MRHLGKRIVKIAPRHRTEIDRRLSTKIIGDWAPHDVEVRAAFGRNGLDEITRRIERKA